MGKFRFPGVLTITEVVSVRARSIPLVPLTIVTLSAAPAVAQDPQDEVVAQLIEYGETTMKTI